MAGEGDHQAGEVTKKTKGGRKGKVAQQVRIDDEATDSNENKFNEAEEESDSDDDNKRYDYHTLAKIHLEGTYNSDHPKWNRTFDDVLAGVLRSTLDTEGEYNTLYLLLDISKAYLTFHQTWKKVKKALTTKMFNADARKLIQEIRAMQTETSLLGAPFGDDAIYAALQRCTIQHPVYKETVATVHQASARAAGSNKQDSDTDKDAESSKTKTRPRRIRCWVLVPTRPELVEAPKTRPIDPLVLEATAVGDISISTEYGEILLQNVLYVHNLNINLLSTNSLMDKGAHVTLDPKGGQIHLADGMLLKIVKNRKSGLLEIRGDTWRQNAMAASTPLFEGVDKEFELAEWRTKVSTKQLWHERLGHPGRDKSRAIINKLRGEPVEALDPNTALTCEPCIQSKSMVARMGQGSGSAGPLDLIHIDLIIDSSYVTEYTCILVLVDDYSNHAFVQLKRIVSFLETQMDRTLKAIRSDQGTERRNNEALEWTLGKGIEWQTTVGLGEKMQTLLIQRNLPKSFWLYAIWAAAFKMNLTPSVDGEFPYQLMFRKSPERFICLMHVFGCLAWVNVPKAKRHNKKLDQRAVPAIFIGYSLERKGWLFYSPEYSPNIFWSNSAKFMEAQCWSDRTEWKPVNIQSPPVPNNEEDLPNLGYMEEDLFDKGDQDPLNEYMSMETTLREGEHKEPRCKAQTSFGLVTTGLKKKERNLNPTIQEALAGEDKRFWEEAMRKELKGLEAMNTWETTDLPRGMNTVDMHWVLKIKTDANLIPTKYKARLVARGFTQREGIDYTEIFAPVAPIQSIRGVLAIAAVWGWRVNTIDVKQAYLNSSLHHDVYLKPPIGTKVQPGKVLKLVKGLYGLKQSGREWNIELDTHLRKIGFHCMSSTPCLYSRGTDDRLTVITAYVDDMLIASPSWKEVDRTKAEIMGKWEMEDNGSVKEFLGIKITRDRSQSKISLDLTAYIKGMVSKWLEKPNEKSWIPMQSVANTVGGNKCTPERAKQYQELVGQLLWVSNTVQPGISFTVEVLARHMSEPIDSAWQAAIHLLKYLNQTSKYRLELGGKHKKHERQPVVMYTDTNWASDPTNVSRTGPTVGNDGEGEIERRGRGDYQTSEGVDERVDCES
ncbi:uncharacterized protein UDID_17272 [Ustilago sp. UG-2017a]|nr:uncharacterized protein UDID_17272 [Ustilago sp. UG-2017a]